MVDAIGSMTDEIAKIQDTIFDVAARIDALPGQPNTRYGMVTYRDRGDEFVTRTYEFTSDVGDCHGNLSMIYADGGGDANLPHRQREYIFRQIAQYTRGRFIF